jgi:hypothetical protein
MGVERIYRQILCTQRKAQDPQHKETDAGLQTNTEPLGGGTGRYSRKAVMLPSDLGPQQGEERGFLLPGPLRC